MPALPDAAKILKIEFTGTFQDSVFANVLHARYSGSAPSVADLDDFALDFLNAWLPNVFTLQSNGCQIDHEIVTDLSSTTAARSDHPVVGATGSNAGDYEPANVSACISWKISRRYRGGHPRTYMPGITETMRDTPTQLESTYTTALQAGANAFIADVAAISVGSMGTIEFGQLSYYNGGALRVTPLFDPIIGATVNSRIDSQRRRLGR